MENNVVCAVCGKPHHKQASEIERSKSGKFYCSIQCVGKDRRKDNICPVCNKGFFGNKTFCSRKCANKSRTGIRYKTGQVNSKATRIQVVKRMLFLERGYACETCGYDNINILQVHHIIPRAEGGSDELSNLLLVCPNCHYTLHLGDSRIDTPGELAELVLPRS